MVGAIEAAFQKARAAKALKAAQAVTPSDIGAQLVSPLRNAAQAGSVVAAAPANNAAPRARSGALPSNVATGRPRSNKPKPARPPGYQSIPADFEASLHAAVTFPDRGLSSPPHYRHLRPPTPVPVLAPDKVTLAFSHNASVDWQGGPPVTSSLLRRPADLGRLVSMSTSSSSMSASVREVVMGFDFGTSSTKVVVGDRVSRQAYAVTFRDAVGIDTFLLPARLYEDLGSYSLHGGPIALTDLKLSLMANPNDSICQERVVAYLALAIREVRGWLFSAHAETYARAQIVWSLALGLPANEATRGPLTQLFERLARVAWALAESAGQVTTSQCSKSLQEEIDSCGAHQNLDVMVIPEYEAQIFGFVRSTQFDAKSRNIFLIVDVGAGTVDSCLFRVAPGRGGSWRFERYTTAVEPNGVMNLHRHRVAWWQRELMMYPQCVGLHQQLEAIKFGTEHQAHIPGSFQSYMKGVDVAFSGRAVGPDQDFSANRLVAQVKGRTLHRAFVSELLPKQDLSDVPFFLCGGGSRLGFYQTHHENLRQTTGFTWLSARKRELAIPNDLRADGLKQSDFDRLSVAYGLSMLKREDMAAATPMPRLRPEPSDQWRNHYVAKDQV